MVSFGAEGGELWQAQCSFPCMCDMLSKLYAGHELAGLLIYSAQSGIKYSINFSTTHLKKRKVYLALKMFMSLTNSAFGSVLEENNLNWGQRSSYQKFIVALEIGNNF